MGQLLEVALTEHHGGAGHLIRGKRAPTCRLAQYLVQVGRKRAADVYRCLQFRIHASEYRAMHQVNQGNFAADLAPFHSQRLGTSITGKGVQGVVPN